MNKLVVQKFGGTSLQDLTCLNRVANHIIRTRNEGYDVIAVVSAMGDTTDTLIELARSVQKEPAPREYDMLLATGEQVAISLLSMALQREGCPARSLTASQVRLETDDNHKRARIKDIKGDAAREALARGEVVIIAGFQGCTSAGEVTTLGRGGSDTSAVAIAAAFSASECQIYTDVDGIYTADPRVEPSARRLKQISYDAMLEMASLGAKVVQTRAVEFASKYQVPLRVLSTERPDEGTIVTSEALLMENPKVTGIAFSLKEAKISVQGIPNKPTLPAEVLGPVAEAGIDVDMIIQNVPVKGEIDLTFTVSREHYADAMAILDKITPGLGAANLVGDEKIAKISLIGVGMRNHAMVACNMFKTLADQGIALHLIATSEIKVSVLVDEKYTEQGVRALHNAFGLAEAAAGNKE